MNKEDEQYFKPMPKEEVDTSKGPNIFFELLKLDEIEPNSVIVIKVSPEDANYATELQLGIIKKIIEPNIELMRRKNLSVIFMSRDDSIELISETEMENAGWIRKSTYNLTDDKPTNS